MLEKWSRCLLCRYQGCTSTDRNTPPNPNLLKISATIHLNHYIIYLQRRTLAIFHAIFLLTFRQKLILAEKYEITNISLGSLGVGEVGYMKGCAAPTASGKKIDGALNFWFMKLKCFLYAEVKCRKSGGTCPMAFHLAREYLRLLCPLKSYYCRGRIVVSTWAFFFCGFIDFLEV